MQIEFIANASCLVTLADGRTVLSDPWYSDGIYYGSWYNFPPLSDAALRRYLGLKPDFIYISHLHPDHLDAATLDRFPSNTPVLIGRLPHDHLERAIRRAGMTNTVQLDLEETTDVDGVEFTIYGDFSGSSEDFEVSLDYAIDTSIFIRDRDGQTFFNINDNPIQVESAERVVGRHGHPTAAVVPYSGASLYPHAFPQYDDAEKDRQRDALTERMLKKFASVTRVLKPGYTIPAAGSYVMGGRIAHYSRWLHQATPAQISACCRAEELDETEICFMAQGDTLDTSSGELVLNQLAPFRDFDIEQRTVHAMTLSDNPLAHEKVVIPDEFALPWQRLLPKARANQWARQSSLGLYPAVDVVLRLDGADGGGLDFAFPLDRPEIYGFDCQPPAGDRPVVQFRIDARLMAMVLLSAAIWNNIEIGALVEIERRPDRFSPDVHRLMSFFAL